MKQDSLEIALIKYNKKTWCKSGLLGFFIGLAVIVPGISGSTVAIIFKLYDQFLYAVGNLFKKFKQCFAFLLPIGLGMVLGVGASLSSKADVAEQWFQHLPTWILQSNSRLLPYRGDSFQAFHPKGNP